MSWFDNENDYLIKGKSGGMYIASARVIHTPIKSLSYKRITGQLGEILWSFTHSFNLSKHYILQLYCPFFNVLFCEGNDVWMMVMITVLLSGTSWNIQYFLS